MGSPSLDLRSDCNLNSTYIKIGCAPNHYPNLLSTMNFFRQYIAPLVVVMIFLLALVAVSARIFLPSDMAAPATVDLDSLSTIISK